MNKHKKLAIFIAPILMVIGYIAADYFAEYQAQEDTLFELVGEGKCDVLSGTCVLIAGDFKINVFDKNGITTVNSTFPLEKVTLFIVDENNQAQAYSLKMIETAYYWHLATPLRETMTNSNNAQKLRLIIKIKGGQYISEFVTQ